MLILAEMVLAFCTFSLNELVSAMAVHEFFAAPGAWRILVLQAIILAVFL